MNFKKLNYKTEYSLGSFTNSVESVAAKVNISKKAGWIFTKHSTKSICSKFQVIWTMFNQYTTPLKFYGKIH